MIRPYFDSAIFSTFLTESRPSQTDSTIPDLYTIAITVAMIPSNRTFPFKIQDPTRFEIFFPPVAAE